MRGLLRHQNAIAQESIDFQSGAFFKELTMIFAAMQEAGSHADESFEQYETQLMACVKHHTGLFIGFSIDDYDPCIEVPQVNRNNVLIGQFFRQIVTSRDGLDSIARNGGPVKGTVSLRTSKATGIWSEFKAVMHLPDAMFRKTFFKGNNKFLPEEIAAIALHEVGHVFTYCEYMSRSVTTNQVLAYVSRALDKTNSLDERETILTSASKALKLNDVRVKELAKVSNSKAVEVVLVSNLVDATKGELGANIYDATSWEYLCDQFSARHGAGRYLVTGLDKIMRGNLHTSYQNMAVFLFLEAMKLALIIAPNGWLLSLMMMSKDAKPEQYDQPEMRMKRIRNQVVERLKDKIPKEEAVRLHEDLEAIDKVMKQVDDKRQFISVVMDFVLPWSRKNRDMELLQKNLENLAANELFVKASELNQLA